LAEKLGTGFGLMVIDCWIGALFPDAFDKTSVIVKVPAAVKVAVVFDREVFVKITLGLLALHAKPVALPEFAVKLTLTPAQFLLK
jgi:hypothetical protein